MLAVYGVACMLGCLGSTFCNGGILLKSAVAVIIAVAIIFTGSVSNNNSSVFDPWWSIAPPLMVLYFFYLATSQQPWDIRSADHGHLLAVRNDLNELNRFTVHSTRVMVLLVLTLCYSVRLTWNFLRGWPGLSHEDWRYADFRRNTGKAYWPVSFIGIHFFPALMVFGGTLSIWVTVVQGFRPLNIMDFVAVVVTGMAVFLEATADRQLRGFVNENKGSGRTMNKGLWALSRHPNYLGEILFWWGLYFFALAANPTFWWVIIGPLAITLMFIFISIPMIEKRLLASRSDYKFYREKVSMLIPLKTSNTSTTS